MKLIKNKNIKKKVQANENDIDLNFALKTLGYLLPITDEEISSFNEINGNTEIDLPESLKIPDFLRKETTATVKINQPIPYNNPQLKKPNDYFKKIVLAAEIAYQLHSEPTFGHIKFVKIYCLCNEIGNMQLNTNFGKYAAGPLDPQLMYSIDAEFKKRKWFKIIKNTHGYKYSLDVKGEEYKKYYGRYFSNQLDTIEKIITLFKKSNSSFCEIVATLFFVWKYAIKNNAIITDGLLYKGFYEWDEKKKRFKENELEGALIWMKENSIIPIK